MPSVTIKDIPPRLLQRVRARAARERRSMNGEIIRLLDEALASKQERTPEALRERASAQADAWVRLRGRCRGRGSAKKQIAAVYAARSRELPCSL